MAEKTSIIRIKLLGGKETDDELRRLEKTLNQVRQSRKRLNKARKENKITNDQLAKTQSRLNLRYKVASQRLRDLQNSQLRATGALRKARTVGDSVVTSMGKLALRFAGVAVAVMVFKNVINTFKKFQQANADLASILGKTRAEISDLTEDAKRLGSTTAFTASEVSKLQKEFAKLGFNEKEIKNATKSTLALAAATGTDLARAAEVVGSNIRAFGLDASESQRVVDVMAMSFSSSALDMEKFATAMRSVAPVAKNAGLTIEQTTSQIGILVDRGVDASTAGTALRNIFLELAKSGMTAEEAFEMINTSANKNATALELFGKRGATVATILAENGDQALILEGKLNGAGGAAQRMADEQLDTLEGKLTILGSAWEGFILSLEDGDGAFSNLLQGIVETTTGVLSFLSGTESANDALDAQITKVADLETTLNPLLDRYDELQIAIELSTGEQEELDDIIQDIAKHLPGAITQFDKYGKALDISTKAARGLIQEQKDLTVFMNIDAIAAEEKELGKMTFRLAHLNSLLEVNRNRIKKGLPIDTKLVKITKELGEAIRLEISARKTKLAQLKGEQTDIEKAAIAAKAAKAASDAKNKLLAEEVAAAEAAAAADKIKTKKEQEEADKRVKIAIDEAKKKFDLSDEQIFKIKETIGKIDAELAQAQALGLDIEEAFFGDEEVIVEDADFIVQKFQETLAGKEQALAISLENEKISQAQHDAELAELRKKDAEDVAKTEKQKTDIKNAERNIQLQATSSILDSIAGMAKEGSAKQKVLSSASALINTYLGVTGALANSAPPPIGLGPIGAIATAISIGVQGLANVAKINGIQFARGGIANNGGVFQGNSHANGGIPFAVGGRVGFEAEGGEAIINKRSTKRYRPLLSAINQAGGGVRFGHGGVTFQDGGIQAPTSAIDAISDNGMNDNFAETLASSINAQIASTRVINVVSDTTEAQTSVANAESEATFG